MDLTLDEAHQAVADLSQRILTETCPPERLREIEREGDWFARDAWRSLAEAGLLGAALPEEHGGGGLGFLAACLICEATGRTVAPVPVLPTLVLGALPIVAFGTARQQAELLPGVIDGDAVLTAALAEGRDPIPPAVPATTARRHHDGGWVLEGVKSFVPAAHVAARMLVPASAGGTVRAFLVPPEAPDDTLDRQLAMHGEPLWQVRLDGVAVAADAELGQGSADGSEVVHWLGEHLAAAACMVEAGVCEQALALTARYVSEREQFGAKIATFQAVSQRAADAYIDTEAVRLTALGAAWRLDAGLDASTAVSIAKHFTAEAGQRVVHAAQHLHGGIGMDLDYPIHRYFRWAKHYELLAGGSTAHLRRLGASLA
jgi:alkylation response protein AidB-like acyl-CoA dehydrogenase